MGNVRLYGATSGYTELAPPAVAPDGVLSLPSGTGTIAKTTDQGLVHINTTAFSAVSSVSVNGCFTSTYSNYLLVVEMTVSTSTNVAFRLRVGGTDDSSSNYQFQDLFATSTSISASTATDSKGYIQGGSGSTQFWVHSNFYNPALAIPTTTVSNSLSLQPAIGFRSMRHSLSTAYDGVTIFPTSGTFTGTIRAYGYKNS